MEYRRCSTVARTLLLLWEEHSWGREHRAYRSERWNRPSNRSEMSKMWCFLGLINGWYSLLYDQSAIIVKWWWEWGNLKCPIVRDDCRQQSVLSWALNCRLSQHLELIAAIFLCCKAGAWAKTKSQEYSDKRWNFEKKWRAIAQKDDARKRLGVKHSLSDWWKLTFKDIQFT